MMGKGIISHLKFKNSYEGFDHNKFAKLLEDAYVSTARDGKGTKKSTFSPSTIGYGHGNCARYWFIAFTGADFDETKDAAAIANMLNGTYAHDRIQKIMEKTGTVVALEHEVKNEDPPIRGFADVIVEMDDERVVGEIKTTKDEVFAIKQSSNNVSGNHLLQILTYMKILGIKNGFVLYENKNTQEILIIPVSMNERNEKVINEVFDWLRSVRKLFDDGILPMRGFTKSNYACKGCPVKDVCWKELGDGDVEIATLVPPK